MGLLDLPTLTPGHSGTPVCPFTLTDLGVSFLPDFVYQLRPTQWPNDLIKYILVGGFNPFENIRQIGSLPQVGVKIKNI